jgi:hypothetical protein
MKYKFQETIMIFFCPLDTRLIEYQEQGNRFFASGEDKKKRVFYMRVYFRVIIFRFREKHSGISQSCKYFVWSRDHKK